MLQALIPIAGALIAGAVGKKTGEKVEKLTTVPAQKILAPLLALLGAGGTTAVTDSPETLTELGVAAGPDALIAVALYSIIKNLVELIRLLKERK